MLQSIAIIVSLCVVTLCSMSLNAQDIVAHRGSSGEAPENTLAAFELAWKQGADAIEGDFYLTKDGRIVCIHDADTERTTGRKLIIAESTLQELRQLEYGKWKHEKYAGEPIPTLENVLATVPVGKYILIEIKCGPEIVPVLKEIVDSCDLKRDQLRIICFNGEVVANCKEAMPDIKAYWLTAYEQDEMTGEWSPSIDSILKTLERTKADGLDCQGELNVLNRAFVSQLREHDYEFHTWTINELGKAIRLKDLGVDSITTDYPAKIRKALTKDASLTHGPFVGHATAQSVNAWARCSEPGDYQLAARSVGERTTHTVIARAQAANDLCIKWTLGRLSPNTEYTYEILHDGDVLARDVEQRFRTASDRDAASVTTLAFGSCAREDTGSAGVWKQMKKEDPHAVVLLGDTPYIDSTDLKHQRERYREFAAVPEFAQLLRGRSLYATWDDHDFGRNDTNGILAGKATSRQVFLEYHANPTYGDGREGVYTKFRRGPVEVFLLDARYFAAVEPSPFDGEKPTLLGRKQWKWLQSELKSSTAPFKILAGGMIWNGAVRPNKPDHWETYAHEREALYNFLGRERISGVVLVGGDIHRTRVLTYDTTGTVGYPLTELITSPIHEGIIESANAPHPNLDFDAGMPHSFLLMEVDSTQSPASLTARFKNSAGKEFHTVRLFESDLD